MKIKQRDREWAAFAIRNRHRFNFTGSSPVEYQASGNLDGIRAFKTHDSTGKSVPSKHPNIAACLYNVKASVNLHVKMWAEGVREGTFAMAEMRAYLSEINAPAWVADALDSMARRVA